MPLERYIITDKDGITFYIYCNIFYEQITEEFLLNNYEIRKIEEKKMTTPVTVLFPGGEELIPMYDLI